MHVDFSIDLTHSCGLSNKRLEWIGWASESPASTDGTIDSVSIVKRPQGPFLNKAAIKAFSCKVLLKFLRSNPRKPGGMQWNAVNPFIFQIKYKCHLLLGLPRLDSHVWPPFSFHQPLQGSWSPNCPWARGWLARNHPCWCGSDVPQWGVGGIRWGGSWGVGDILQASIKLEDLPEMWIVFLGKPMIFHSYLSWSGYFLHFNAYFHRFAVKTDDSICEPLGGFHSCGMIPASLESHGTVGFYFDSDKWTIHLD